jgi:hypothetical protein
VTVDQALDKVTREIDAILQKRWIDLELRIFADGCSDFDAIRVVVEDQREIDLAWRKQALESLRSVLAAQLARTERTR